MIRPPSNQRTYDLFVTCDPAIIQPPAKPADGEPLDEYKAALEAYETKIRVARETGNWTDVVVPGQSPTKFTVGQVDRNAFRELQDRAMLPADSERRIGMLNTYALVFRMAIRSISGFDKFERLPDPKWDNWTLAPAKLAADLDDVHASIIPEIAAEILRRLNEPSPLS